MERCTSLKYSIGLLAVSVSMVGCAVHEKQAPTSRVSGLYTYEVNINERPRTESQAEAAGRAPSETPVSRSSKEAAVVTEPLVSPTQTQDRTPQKERAERSVGQPVGMADVLIGETGQGELDIRPGQCWVYAQVQPRPVEGSVTVKVRDSEVRLDVTPAEFSRGFKQIVTKEGTKTFQVKPAVYKEVEEQVLVKPETTKLVVEPAVYEEVEEEVVLEQARTELEPCRTSGAAAYGASSAVFGFCAKEIPARTKSVTVTRLVKPETTRTEIVPAEFKTVTRRVVEQPAEVIPVELGDETESFEIAELVQPAKAIEQEIPAETMDVPIRRYEGRPQIVARQAVCDKDLTRDRVRQIQSRLSQLGYKPGEVDGLPGPRTIEALTQYQIEQGLASGAITLETIQRLGLND